LAADFNGFRWNHQDDVLKGYDVKFFEAVTTFFRTRTKQLSTSFLHALFPYNPLDSTIVDRTKSLLETLTPDDAILSRLLREKLDDLKRASRCYALYTD